MSTEKEWFTAITDVAPNRIIVRGYRLEDLVRSVTFTDAAVLLLKGELPGPNEREMFDAVLVSAVDHGASPPSTLAARTVASTGGALNASLAAGLLSINSYHGGAVENCMRFLQEAVFSGEHGDAEEAADKIAQKYLEAKKRIPGYGHRMHRADPRVKVLKEKAEKLGFAGSFVRMALAVETALCRRGKELPLNVDGIMAALLCEMGYPPEMANAVFMFARLPGLIAHSVEERLRQRPVRRIDPAGFRYDGPAVRDLG
ncbi:MAG TPA: citryl-CoA lyase [Desulfotomaculum sp.]|nr:citryl-CoA lyase [Desulfotomaculum sp.]